MTKTKPLDSVMPAQIHRPSQTQSNRCIYTMRAECTVSSLLRTHGSRSKPNEQQEQTHKLSLQSIRRSETSLSWQWSSKSASISRTWKPEKAQPTRTKWSHLVAAPISKSHRTFSTAKAAIQFTARPFTTSGEQGWWTAQAPNHLSPKQGPRQCLGRPIAPLTCSPSWLWAAWLS